MSTVKFYNDVEFTGKLQRAPAPLPGFFVPGIGLVENIEFQSVGFTLQPVVVTSEDQQRKLDKMKDLIAQDRVREAQNYITDSVGSVAASLVEDESDEDDNSEDSVEENASVAAVSAIDPLVSLGYDIGMTVIYTVDGEEQRVNKTVAQIFIGTPEIDEDADADEFGIVCANNFLAHAEDTLAKVREGFAKHAEIHRRMAAVTSKVSSAAMLTGEIKVESGEQEKLAAALETMRKNIIVRINKMAKTPKEFEEQFIGADEEVVEGEANSGLEFNEFYPYLLSVIPDDDSAAFKLLTLAASVNATFADLNEAEDIDGDVITEDNSDENE